MIETDHYNLGLDRTNWKSVLWRKEVSICSLSSFSLGVSRKGNIVADYGPCMFVLEDPDADTAEESEEQITLTKVELARQCCVSTSIFQDNVYRCLQSQTTHTLDVRTMG